MSKLLQVSKSKYRAVISEMLPYERPVFFTNRYFARFLKYYGIRIKDDRLEATKHVETEGLQPFLQVLGGAKGAERPCFQYYVTKDGHFEGRCRCLTIIHPFHQVEMVSFYDQYKTLLLDFCQRSNFSIRFPYKVATCQKKQKGYYKLMSDDAMEIDTSESLKHFFAYKYYKNINFFYGDYRFLRAEKKFSHMTKIDLKHCFETIAPESLSIALFGHPMEECEGSMAHEFYRLQHHFANKKKGIVIGPEFSRIYAEMILQRIDLNVERDLERQGIIRNSDYIYYRYVDDGFLYYDDFRTKALFFCTYVNRLKEYNLKINKKKLLAFDERPFMEPISIAKSRLLSLVNEKFQNRLETFKGFVKMQECKIDTPTSIDFKNFINEVRQTISTDGKTVGYKEVMSFLLGTIQRHLLSLLGDFNRLYGQYKHAYAIGEINEQGLSIKEKYEREFIQFCSEIVEIMFYLLGCDMRMSTSIKVISIIDKLQMFVRGRYNIEEGVKSAKFPLSSVEMLDDKISDEIASLLLNTTPKSYNLMEILNVLELEKVMSVKNQIAPKVLNGFMGKLQEGQNDLNYFVVFELIHFIKDYEGYDELKEELYGWIETKIHSLKEMSKSDTEAVLTFLETMSCPWIDARKKKMYSKTLFGEQADEVHRFADRQKNLFIQWHDFNLNEAIQQFNSSEVY